VVKLARYLAGDIGGTKVLMAVCESAGGAIKVVAEHRYASADYASFDAIADDFLQRYSLGPIAGTGLGIAGPVINDRCVATNLPWVVDRHELAARLPLGAVALINDFKAAALGVLRLGPDDSVELNPGLPVPGGPIAVLGAGTGLGEALLFDVNGRYQVIPTEGGHKDFAPRNEEEMDLLRFMLKRHARVSYERLVSGAGIKAIYDFLIDSKRVSESPEVQVALLNAADPSAVIAELAHTQADAACVRAMDMFVSIYGAEAGNLALQIIATGGVYLCGGIAPKNLAKMLDGSFQRAYCHKGRFSDLVCSIPVRLVINQHVALLGACAAAIEASSPNH
jgi:glucokinase